MILNAFWLVTVKVLNSYELCSIFGINLNEFLAGEDIAQENMIQKPFKCDRKTVIRSSKTLLTYALYRTII